MTGAPDLQDNPEGISLPVSKGRLRDLACARIGKHPYGSDMRDTTMSTLEQVHAFAKGGSARIQRTPVASAVARASNRTEESFMRRMAVGFICAIVALVALSAIPPGGSVTQQGANRSEAERLVREGSFKLALEAYRKIDRSSLGADEKRWVEFRLADLLWRSAPEGSDTTPLDEASRALDGLLRDDKGNDIRDRAWVEAQESLGDLSWMRRHDWSTAWTHYSAALDWWAGSRDIEQARARYLGIIWKASGSEQQRTQYGYYAISIPLDVLENAAKIATTPDEKSHAAYLIAMQLIRQGDAESVERTRRNFEAAIAAGKASEWYDDALFQYAQWLERSGVVTALDDGGWRIEPDYEAAVSMYRRVLSEYAKGETRYWDQSKAAPRRHHAAVGRPRRLERLPPRIESGVPAPLAQRRRHRALHVEDRPDERSYEMALVAEPATGTTRSMPAPGANASPGRRASTRRSSSPEPSASRSIAI